jgi:hypothetical protein
MPLNFLLSKRYGIRLLTGANPGHEIGTGFADAGEDIDKLVNNGAQDYLQAGVVGETSWSFTASINSGTGEVGSTGEIAESIAWLPDPVVSGALIRTVTPKGALPKLKPSLPPSGKYVSCTIELAPKAERGGNAAATVTITTGTAKATLEEAEAEPLTPGLFPIRRIYIHNNSGTYELAGQSNMCVVAANQTTTAAKSLILTEETCSSSSFAFLGQPDRALLYLPAHCLIDIAFYAEWANGSTTTGGAAGLFIFLPSTGEYRQIKQGSKYVEAECTSAASTFTGLSSSSTTGLASAAGEGALEGYGQMIGVGNSGGTCRLFTAETGLYEVGIKFKRATGEPLKVKSRRLWVTVVA